MREKNSERERQRLGDRESGRQRERKIETEENKKKEREGNRAVRNREKQKYEKVKEKIRKQLNVDSTVEFPKKCFCCHPVRKCIGY